MAKDVATLKAVSQNLMHQNLSVTDGVYGILSVGDVSREISQLGANHKAVRADDMESLVTMIERLENLVREQALGAPRH